MSEKLKLLDRELQQRLLHTLASAYPAKVPMQQLGFEQQDPVGVRNLTYLEEHGLTTLVKANAIGTPPAVVLAGATARGMDFLEADGGLSAILGTVTVRFEADTLRAMIEARIDATDADPTLKQKIKEGLQDLGVEGLKEASKSLMSLAWQNAPAALQALQALL